jgi:serine/threonine protein phosphatase PrpC
MTRTSGLRKPYVFCLLAVALTLLAVLGGKPARLDAFLDTPFALIVWGGIALVAALAPFPRRRGRAPLSWTPAVDFAALLAFGPAAAVWFAVLGRVVSNTASRWTPFTPAVFRLAQGVAAIGISGWFYAGMGGRFGRVSPADPNQGVALLFAAGAYLALDTAAWWIDRILGGARPGTRGGDSFRRRVGSLALLLPLGALVGMVQGSAGSGVSALFLLPLALSWAAGRTVEDTRRGNLESLRKLMSAIDAGDPFRRGFLYRIAKMSVKVARHLGLPDWEVDQIESAALLHDLGRVAVQHELWGKTGKLSRKEENFLRAHPRIGADLVLGFGICDPAAEIILAHHERPDGKGYPRGLKAPDIPMGSRIIMAVAAFDAMTSDRPYRRGLGPDAAFEELLAHSGTQFFPEVVEALIELYSKGTLFEEFEEDEIARYRQGELSSRALERVLGRNAPVPEKRGLGKPGRGDDVPVIDLPEAGKGSTVEDREYPLTPSGELRVVVGARSDVGCVRSNNEDAYGTFTGRDPSQGVLLVLADGMGGAAAGEVASQLAVDGVGSGYFRELHDGEAGEALRRSIEGANVSIFDRASSDSDLKGMGTTCTAVSLIGESMRVAHVGDSRAYLIADGAIHVLTRDHTLAAELAHMGGGMDIAPEGARNVLTRCLGNQPDVQVEISNPVRLPEGSALVLCSDGLSNMVRPEEIREAASAHDPGEACEQLVALARERGGPDNITVQIARILRD